jgi:hypothetical protein
LATSAAAWSGSRSKAESFDVFLCHNSEDKPAIREISGTLAQENITAWLDEDEIRPGTSWQTELGWQIASIGSAAVLLAGAQSVPGRIKRFRLF